MIDVCNKANVAVYPIDVRGLVTGAPGAQGENRGGPLQGAFLVKASYAGGSHEGSPQHPTAGGGGTSGGGSKGGTTSTGGSTGSRPGGGTTTVSRPPTNLTTIQRCAIL